MAILVFGTLACAAGESSYKPDATSLDSWLAISSDGNVTVFTGKVELGTGTQTALAQIVAEELDVPFRQIKMECGDTSKTIDQGLTVASRTGRARQASTNARRRCCRRGTPGRSWKLAAARLDVPEDKLEVNDGVVSVSGDQTKNVSYASLIGGKRFDVKITATITGTGWDLKVAPEVAHMATRRLAQNRRESSVPRMD